MARTLIGNFKGPEGPRGQQGPQGEQGPRGAVGPPGEDGQVDDINTNLISFSQDDWLEGSTYATATGEIVVSTTGRARLINKIPVDKGEEYTLSDYSAYASAISRVRVYVFDGDDFVRTTFANRGGTITFTAEGDQIGVGLEPLDGFSIQKRHIVHPNYTMMFKLEKGSEPTKMVQEIHDNKRRIDGLSNTAFFDGNFTGTNTGGVTTTEPIELNNSQSYGIGHDGATLTLQPGFYIYGCNMVLSSTEYTLAVDVVLSGDIKQRYVSTPTDRAISFTGMLVVESESTLVFKAGTGASMDEISFNVVNNNKVFVKKI